MKHRVRQHVVNEYTGEGQWSGLGAYLMLMVMWLLRPLGLVYGSVLRSSGFLRGKLPITSKRRNHQIDVQRRLALTLDKSVGSLNLAVANRSRTTIWAEEARIDLVDLEADEETCTPIAHAILKIREVVAPSETLHISLINTVYDAAGRPQGVYSCIIGTVLRYRVDEDSEEQFEQSLPQYRTTMISLVPISLRRMGWFDKPARSRRPADAPVLETREQPHRLRRSQRVKSRSAVVVEGTFSDGSSFTDSTHALVLSAHGCLVTLPKPVKIGESVVVRNISTLQEQLCQVVYIGENHGGRTQVGLGFEIEAPEFWGTECLPSIGRQ